MKASQLGAKTLNFLSSGVEVFIENKSTFTRAAFFGSLALNAFVIAGISLSASSPPTIPMSSVDVIVNSQNKPYVDSVAPVLNPYPAQDSGIDSPVDSISLPERENTRPAFPVGTSSLRQALSALNIDPKEEFVALSLPPPQEYMEMIGLDFGMPLGEDGFALEIEETDFGIPDLQLTDEILDAAEYASKKTGLGVGFLLAVASKESSFISDADAKESSAHGLFQFTRQTWLAAVKHFGDKYGLGEYAEHITINRDGVASVRSSSKRKEILALRENPKYSALMTAALILDNQERVESRIDREMSMTELYITHFLGTRGAIDFLKALDRNPKRVSSGIPSLENAVQQNRSIFFSKSKGRERTVREVMSFIKTEMEPRFAFYGLLYSEPTSHDFEFAKTYAIDNIEGITEATFRRN